MSDENIRPSKLKRATREALPLKMQIHGPSGAGKTFSALRIAYDLRPSHIAPEDWKVLVADTEKRSASKYVGEEADGNIFDFYTEDVVPPYSVDKLGALIKLAVEEGVHVLVIDSLTHWWKEAGGILSIVDDEKKRSARGDGVSAWKVGDDQFRKMVNMILTCPIHILCCVRSKQTVAAEKDADTGKTVIKKLGLQPEMRDDFIFALDIECALDPSDHTLMVGKTRCRKLDRGVFPPDRNKEFADTVLEWLGNKVDVTKARAEDAAKHQAILDARAAEVESLNDQLQTFLLEVASIDEAGGTTAVNASAKRAGELFGKAPASITSQVRAALAEKRKELGIAPPAAK